uniref:Solute carrier family 25 member 44b n=1 Tax=Petromyzon marinus TaxID=7757 RepID=S4RV58_PETMA
MQEKRNIRVIEWADLDKRKFYSLGVFMMLSVRATVYPFTLIRTRLQVQRGRSQYRGTADAFIKILQREGVLGLYRGFAVNALTLVSGQFYITTYELVRDQASRLGADNTLKSVAGGGVASLVAQSITVPIDVVSQHLMMQGQAGEGGGRFKVQDHPKRGLNAHAAQFGQARDIVRQIRQVDGMRGFYRGYLASLLTYIPSSAVWWPFYHLYAEQLSSMAPSNCPHLVLQAVAGPMASVTASVLTNPMDVIRTRLQVEGRSSILEALRQLWAQEGMWGFTKGLSARIASSAPTSMLVVLGYETLKRLSLRTELVHTRHW